jgi:electron transport complex protein RnfB
MSIFIELFVSKKVLAQKGQKTLKTQPSKTCLDAKFRYYATVDAGACTGCGTCVEKCQVKAAALSEKLGIPTIDLNRCIGCGNCVPDCPSGAMRLVKKEKGVVPPETRDDLYDVIMAHKKGALAKIRLATRLMLKK